jgi:hypothetical protein
MKTWRKAVLVGAIGVFGFGSASARQTSKFRREWRFMLRQTFTRIKHSSFRLPDNPDLIRKSGLAVRLFPPADRPDGF